MTGFCKQTFPADRPRDKGVPESHSAQHRLPLTAQHSKRDELHSAEEWCLPGQLSSPLPAAAATAPAAASILSERPAAALPPQVWPLPLTGPPWGRQPVPLTRSWPPSSCCSGLPGWMWAGASGPQGSSGHAPTQLQTAGAAAGAVNRPHRQQSGRVRVKHTQTLETAPGPRPVRASHGA